MSPLVAHDLGLRTRRGWVFQGVSLRVGPGDLVAITGPAGSGRTSLLLALAGYFTSTDGSLARRAPAALGYVPGVHAPEPGLTVAEHVRERLLLLGRWPWRPGRRAELIDGLLAAFPGGPGDLGRDLSGYQRHRLMLTLAGLGQPTLVLVDDVDAGLDTAEQAELWATLAELADAGHGVVACCRELPPGVPVREYRLGGAQAR